MTIYHDRPDWHRAISRGSPPSENPHKLPIPSNTTSSDLDAVISLFGSFRLVDE